MSEKWLASEMILSDLVEIGVFAVSLMDRRSLTGGL